MRMHNPPHPGEVSKVLVLEPMGLSIAATARALGVSRKHLSGIVNGHCNVTPEMANRLSLAFGSSAEHWRLMQMSYDLWQVDKRAAKIKVRRLTASLNYLGTARGASTDILLIISVLLGLCRLLLSI
jgi:antitoxin HigA-1